MLYIGLGFGGSIIFCMLFPNGQDLRPTDFQQNDCFIWLVKRIYAADTNTNVIPSMHVIGCAALALACFDAPRLRPKNFTLCACRSAFLSACPRSSSSSTRCSTFLSRFP